MDRTNLHIYLLVRLKSSSKTDIVDKSFLKESIRRTLLTRGGLKGWMTNYIIEDLQNQGLITCINNRELYRLNSCEEEKRIKALLLTS